MIMGLTLIQVFKNSFVMIILLLASIAALGLIVERFWYFTRNRFRPNKALVELRRRLGNGGVSDALGWAKSGKNPLSRLMATALENVALTSDELSDLLYSQILDERVRYERLLGGMGTLANAATLLGLLGTVIGLIQAFGNIAMTGSGGPAVVSGGIAQALLTTAFGLIIGIPTLFFYNYFSKKAADMSMNLESASDRVVVMIERYKKHVAGAGRQPAAPAPLAPEPRPEPKPAPQQTEKASGWDF